MNKQNSEFVRLNASTGEKFFRRSSISSFGYTEKTSTTSPTVREVRVVYQTSGATARALTYTVTERKEFDSFRDSLLNSPEPPGTPTGSAGTGKYFRDESIPPDISTWLPPGDTMVIQCQDGPLNVSVKAYLESAAVRDFIDRHTGGWIASHSRKDVSDELEELYIK